MKKCLSILSLFAICWRTQPATTVQAAVPPGYEQVSPGALLSFNLLIQGCDTVSVSANGSLIDAALKYPFSVSFAGVNSGTNTVVITYCDWNGRTGSTTNYLITGFRTFPRKLHR